MDDQILTAFWIKPPSTQGPLGFGITAWSLSDALRILTTIGYELPENLDELKITENVKYADLHHHVQKHMGPMIVRGLWYPFFKLGM